MISKKNTFAAIHDKKQGKASDKWESYLEFYDELFTPLKKNPITLLQIGVQNGGSLETYAEYPKISLQNSERKMAILL